MTEPDKRCCDSPDLVVRVRCDRHPMAVRLGFLHRWGYRVRCRSCDGKGSWEPTLKLAVRAWNSLPRQAWRPACAKGSC